MKLERLGSDSGLTEVYRCAYIHSRLDPKMKKLEISLRG